MIVTVAGFWRGIANVGAVANTNRCSDWKGSTEHLDLLVAGTFRCSES